MKTLIGLAFKEGKRLSELRSKNQEKAFQAFWDRKRFNEMQKNQTR